MIIIPNVEEIRILTWLFGTTLTVKLFATDVVPTKASTVASFTEAAGGGYAAIPLLSGSWTHTPGVATPSYSLYDETIEWVFTGVTTGTGIIYGYYVVDSLGVLRWSERFSDEFVPELGARIRFIPRYSCDSIEA